MKHHPATLPVQAHLLIADLPEEKDRLAHTGLEGFGERVLANRLFDGQTRHRFGLKEAVRRHQPIDSLMRPEVVVVRQVERQSAPRLVNRLGQDLRPEFLLDCRPKPLALADRLRMMGPRHDVLDALA